MGDGGNATGGEPATPPVPWRILCIDDDPEILSLLKTTLSMRHEVVAAASGLDALRIIGFSEPDFIICDIRMPGMDGYETVAAIRRHPEYTNIPVFFLTAERGRDAARRGFAAGCNLFLNKPFDPVRLLENIDYFTRKSGHAVRAKMRTLEDLDHLLEAVRNAPPPQPAEVASARPSPPPPPPEPPAPEPVRRVSTTPGTVVGTDGEVVTDRDAFLADRRRREQEAWAKRFAEIQDFIDRHMKP